MTLPYDEQVKVWAAARFGIDLASIASVKMDNVFNEGYQCCNGRDPGCYCSYYESASMHLSITISRVKGRAVHHEIDMRYGDMGELIKEIYEA